MTMTSLAPANVATVTANKAPKPDRLVGVRHLQAVLMSTGILLSYSLRVNLSVAIVAMVDEDYGYPGYPEYDWDMGIQSVILSSFFWGYVILQFPAGLTLYWFGAKAMLTVCVLGSSVFTLLTPLAADWGGWGLLVAFRAMEGLCQACMFPSAHALVAQWAPVDERGFISTFVAAGSQLGTVVALPLCGILSTSSWGWPSTFYVFGALGVAWSALWLALASNSPAHSRLISTEERRYIEDSIGSSAGSETKRATPLRSILTSLPFWAIVSANCGHGWGFWTLLTEMPTFMSTVLGYDLKSNSLLSAMPYLAMFLLSFVFSWISTVVNNRKLVPLVTSRKIFNSIGLWGPGIFLVGVAYSTDATVTVVLLTMAVGINAGIYLGFNVNHIDLAPNYAGTLMGLTNGAGNMMSIIGPLVVGLVVTESGSASQWRVVFFIASGIYFVTNLIFIIYASADLQPWNDYSGKQDRNSSDVRSTHNNSFGLEKTSLVGQGNENNAFFAEETRTVKISI